MDFAPSPRVTELRARVEAFMTEHVYPCEAQVQQALDDEVRPGVAYPRLLEQLRERAREQGLWNLWATDPSYGPGLTTVEYGQLCEVMGRSPVAPMIFNCHFPDTGNMEVLAEYGTPQQRARWLQPLLEGEIRSCFALTEPDAAGSDPTVIDTHARLEDGEWVIDGHKWYCSGAMGAAVCVAMVVTDPDAPRHRRASMLLVSLDTPGFELVRAIPVMGHSGGPGHCELRFEGARVPEDSILGERGEGFTIAQARLGPGRIHHCMRFIGAAERAFELMCRRANTRTAFGGPLGEKQFVQDFVALSRIEIDAARLMVLHAAWRIDTVGKRAARQEIAMVKVLVANMHQAVLDRAIQVHGSLGMSDDLPLARMWREGRGLRLGDGPDEVHKMVIARRELARFATEPQKALAG